MAVRKKLSEIMVEHNLGTTELRAVLDRDDLESDAI